MLEKVALASPRDGLALLEAMTAPADYEYWKDSIRGDLDERAGKAAGPAARPFTE